MGGCVGPELPQRAQQGRGQQEVEDGARGHVEQGVEAHLPAPQPAAEEDQGQREEEDEQGVQQMGQQPGGAALPQGTQQIVHRGGGRAQQERRVQQLQLGRHVILHPQPKRRDKSEPRWDGRSS